MIETVKKEPLKTKIDSRCRTGGANVERKGVPNRADTHKKGITESGSTGRKKTEVKTRRATTSCRRKKFTN